MRVIHARNVNEALPLGLQLVDSVGVPVMSRGVATWEVPGPVATVYSQPQENVLMCPTRDANPFFHFFEAMWILSGSNTVALPRFFLGSIDRYSDDGKTFHGAYGHRLRHWGGNLDQLGKVISVLYQKPDTRQAVVSIWNPALDLGADTKDTPCNDMIMFKIRNGRLNMTVCNRSNDVIWGAYGANAVQFSFLQAYVAASVGVGVGTYTQMSDSYHVYIDLPLWKSYLEGTYRPTGHVVNPYEGTNYGDIFPTAAEAYNFKLDCQRVNTLANEGVLPSLVMAPQDAWDSDLGWGTARPMLTAYLNYKNGDLRGAIYAADFIQRTDWKHACVAWLMRRAEKAGVL